MVLQFAKDVKLSGHEMSPGENDIQFVLGEADGVLVDERLDEIHLVKEGFPHFEPCVKRPAGELVGAANLAWKNVQSLIDVEHQITVQLEEEVGLLSGEEHGFRFF